MVDVQTLTTMFGGIGVGVAAIYYVFTLRGSTKARHAQMFMGIYEKWNTLENIDASNRIESLKIDSYEEFRKMIRDNTVDGKNITWYSSYLEGLGVLVREKLIDIRLVSLLLHGEIKWFWEKYGPFWKQYRVTENYPRAMIETEYLYDSVMNYGRKNLQQM